MNQNPSRRILFLLVIIKETTVFEVESLTIYDTLVNNVTDTIIETSIDSVFVEVTDTVHNTVYSIDTIHSVDTLDIIQIEKDTLYIINTVNTTDTIIIIDAELTQAQIDTLQEIENLILTEEEIDVDNLPDSVVHSHMGFVLNDSDFPNLYSFPDETPNALAKSGSVEIRSDVNVMKCKGSTTQFIYTCYAKSTAKYGNHFHISLLNFYGDESIKDKTEILKTYNDNTGTNPNIMKMVNIHLYPMAVDETGAPGICIRLYDNIFGDESYLCADSKRDLYKKVSNKVFDWTGRRITSGSVAKLVNRGMSTAVSAAGKLFFALGLLLEIPVANVCSSIPIPHAVESSITVNPSNLVVPYDASTVPVTISYWADTDPLGFTTSYGDCPCDVVTTLGLDGMAVGSTSYSGNLSVGVHYIEAITSLSGYCSAKAGSGNFYDNSTGTLTTTKTINVVKEAITPYVPDIDLKTPKSSGTISQNCVSGQYVTFLFEVDDEIFNGDVKIYMDDDSNVFSGPLATYTDVSSYVRVGSLDVCDDGNVGSSITKLYWGAELYIGGEWLQVDDNLSFQMTY